MAAGKVKFKPRKGVKKRVRFSATGKVKYQHCGMRKLMSGKSGDTKRKLRRTGVIEATSPFAKLMSKLAGES